MGKDDDAATNLRKAIAKLMRVQVNLVQAGADDLVADVMVLRERIADRFEASGGVWNAPQ